MNCGGGDFMSCRALPSDEYQEPRFANLPGAIGRACVHDCDADELQKECVAGFPRSCQQRRGTGIRANPDNENAQRRRALSTVGCAAGIVDECTEARFSSDKWRALAASRTQCLFDRDYCLQLGKDSSEAGKKAEARDAYERACQYGTWRMNCYQLGLEYLTGTFPEPFKGRAGSVLFYACTCTKIRQEDPFGRSGPRSVGLQMGEAPMSYCPGSGHHVPTRNVRGECYCPNQDE